MSSTIRDISDVIVPPGSTGMESVFLLLRDAVNAVLFCADERTKGLAVDIVNTEFRGRIKRCFTGDDQVFLTWQNPNEERSVFYVCDVPDEYFGKGLEQRQYSF